MTEFGWRVCCHSVVIQGQHCKKNLIQGEPGVSATFSKPIVILTQLSGIRVLTTLLRQQLIGADVTNVVVTQPLPRDEGIAKNHGALEAGQLFRAWTRVVGRQRVTKDQALQRVCSWTVQNKMCPGLDDCMCCMKDSRFCRF